MEEKNQLSFREMYEQFKIEWAQFLVEFQERKKRGDSFTCFKRLKKRGVKCNQTSIQTYLNGLTQTPNLELCFEIMSEIQQMWQETDAM